MGTAMLALLLNAGVAAPAVEGSHALAHQPLRIAALPMGAWPTRRCGDAAPAVDEAAAGAAIDGACMRLPVHDRRAEHDLRMAMVAGPRRSPARLGDGHDSGGWRLARAVLPGLQGIAGPGGAGIGVGSELSLVRGAHMTLHLAAPRDTRIADTMFAPETTVRARCGACWTESDAIGAGGVRVARRTAER